MDQPAQEDSRLAGRGSFNFSTLSPLCLLPLPAPRSLTPRECDLTLKSTKSTSVELRETNQGVPVKERGAWHIHGGNSFGDGPNPIPIFQLQDIAEGKPWPRPPAWIYRVIQEGERVAVDVEVEWVGEGSERREIVTGIAIRRLRQTIPHVVPAEQMIPQYGPDPDWKPSGDEDWGDFPEVLTGHGYPEDLKPKWVESDSFAELLPSEVKRLPLARYVEVVRHIQSFDVFDQPSVVEGERPGRGRPRKGELTGDEMHRKVAELHDYGHRRGLTDSQIITAIGEAYGMKQPAQRSTIRSWLFQARKKGYIKTVSEHENAQRQGTTVIPPAPIDTTNVFREPARKKPRKRAVTSTLKYQRVVRPPDEK